MKHIVFIALAVAAIVGCSTTAAPNAAQVQQIENACAVDGGLRPTITALIALPGIATPADVAAVAAARAVIDPVCANPSGTVEANTISAVVNANAQLIGILTRLQTRQSVIEGSLK